MELKENYKDDDLYRINNELPTDIIKIDEITTELGMYGQYIFNYRHNDISHKQVYFDYTIKECLGMFIEYLHLEINDD